MRITRNIFLYFSILLLHITWQQPLFAQCSTVITSFPYDEGFESNNGNWITFTQAHWEWGTPVAKAQITSAGGGSKCWIAGGLTGSSYVSGSSELRSPCFDLSSLTYPEISCKVFWETELNYDGATFQYSMDGGANWATLGAYNSNDPCNAIENWYNNASVNFLSGNSGWSGNVQTGSGQCQFGQGSGQWVTAKHNLSNLTGQSNVMFRFVFGAGTICNDFDGFGVDDIHIGEAAGHSADFTYTCGPDNMVQFNKPAIACQHNQYWDFGDPASGVNNNSNIENPSHTFSAPGTYLVSLVAYYDWGPAAVVPPKSITVVNAAADVSNITCNGDANAAITIHVSPPGIYNYTWDTNPVQNTNMINNLGPGVYTVSVTSANTCSIAVPVTITEPPALTSNPIPSAAKCGNDNGSITANAIGGTEPYFYTWSNTQTTPSISNLAPGAYDLSVRDVNGCLATPVTGIIVQAVTNNIIVSLGNNATICPGQTLILNPGSFAGYKWQDNSTGPTFTVTQTGTYSVIVIDQDGCSASSSVDVIVDCKGIYFPSAFTPGTDPLNPAFGALGDLASIKKYNMLIYNRYGQMIFASSNPFQKWDGSFRGKQQDEGAYLWTVSFTQGNGEPVYRKGTVIIIH